MKRVWIIFLNCAFALICAAGYAQTDTVKSVGKDSIEVTGSNKFVISGYVKDLGSIAIPSWNGRWTFDNFVHNRVNVRWYLSENLTLSTEARTRFFFGESISNNPQYVEQVNASLDYVKLGGQIVKGDSYLLNSFIDRANISWVVNKWQLVLGKQRINWGKSYVWNPNDIFNAYSFFDFDYEERRGTDAALVRYSINNTSSVEAATNFNKNFDLTTIAAKYNFNSGNYDFQLLGGKYQTDIVFGGGWAGQLNGAGFKGESTFFLPYKTELKKGTAITNVSFDYTFANTLNFRLEAIYNSNPLKPKNQLFFFQPITAKQLTFNKYSLFLSGGYDITPLIKANINGIWYADDHSYFLNPTLNLNLSDNTEFLIAAQVFGGTDTSTFGKVGSYFFTRLKWSF